MTRPAVIPGVITYRGKEFDVAESGPFFYKEVVVNGEVVKEPWVRCLKCGYEYIRRTSRPKRCPRCQKDLWPWREPK